MNHGPKSIDRPSFRMVFIVAAMVAAIFVVAAADTRLVIGWQDQTDPEPRSAEQSSPDRSGGLPDTDDRDDPVAKPSEFENDKFPAFREGRSGEGNSITAFADVDGDGKSDYGVIRPAAGFLTGDTRPLQWWIHHSASEETIAAEFGIVIYQPVTADFDGDGRHDLAYFTDGGPDEAAFYIFRSSDFTLQVEAFGQCFGVGVGFCDDPNVVGDYDGDGKADVAVYRQHANPQQNFFYYRGTLNNPDGNITYIPWGFGPGDSPVPGDYDGDGRYDFMVRREISSPVSLGNGPSNRFILLKSNDLGVEFVDYGNFSDFVVPGDFDGDGSFDFCLVQWQNTGNRFLWSILERDGGGTGANPIEWGAGGDVVLRGDFDGDGRSDPAIWRPDNASQIASTFWILRSSDLSLETFAFGFNDEEIPTTKVR